MYENIVVLVMPSSKNVWWYECGPPPHLIGGDRASYTCGHYAKQAACDEGPKVCKTDVALPGNAE